MKPYNHHQPLRAAIQHWRWLGHRVALVPTMGALHAGHMALVQEARRQAAKVVVSIFVNPKQFGPEEDFSHYPRTLEADAELCQRHGVDALYLPSVESMYPPSFRSHIHVGELAEHWCGAARPGHFDGVATVVAKLLLQTGVDDAFFGEKDYQQLAIIKRMVEDMNIPTHILAVPTLREKDGLALSSRNRYLTLSERAAAGNIYRILCESQKAIRNGKAVDATLAEGTRQLLACGFASVDYLGLADAETLLPLHHFSTIKPARLLVAARIGKARLIDNLAVYI